MEPLPPAIKDDNFPTDIDDRESNANFKNFVVEMPLTYAWASGTIPQTITSAKQIRPGVLLVKMRDLMFGGNGYGLFIFGRDPALMDWTKPVWMQSWNGLASDLDSAERRLGSNNMDVAIVVHPDAPPPERLATPEELK
ncbi:hypothetical protein HNR46_000885 [Haloferula luteola]|uniref:Uncharacterized protein n=1 Tax=Haloferula luteola TaxID=595692 RepID=A0A840UWX7_9BACT|nr:hypothetical protein [Haloferula luteola]MBB5350657.1 hypothetical protein [Haloferula luteola]